ncbi:hypothetical protein C6501_05515 [Candidatus Poribacteria bacterium]|nr:MAG: hypothetical protein C6501_05515 [Candidatus Poribacteria bacterium]
MDTVHEFEFKRKKYMPIFPKASGKPTVYIEGYPFEDDEPMAATGFHADQITILSDQLSRYFAINEHIYIGVDNFIYYREGDVTKFVAPDIYVVFGVEKYPQRRSFYTWSEGAIPVAVFEFLSDATANQDRHKKVQLYLIDMGVQEYFIHQPEIDKPAEFCGWQRSRSGNILEIKPDAQGGIFSEVLNLWFRWEVQHDSHVRLLRPFLPDGTLITTSREEAHLRIQEQNLRIQEQNLRIQEQNLRIQEQNLREEAEMMAAKEAARRQELEAELETLRAQLANRQDGNM